MKTRLQFLRRERRGPRQELVMRVRIVSPYIHDIERYSPAVKLAFTTDAVFGRSVMGGFPRQILKPTVTARATGSRTRGST